MEKLYRVVRELYYNGGRGCDRVEAVEVLYCGYDRAEALRVYHAAAPECRGASPGNRGRRVRFGSRSVTIEAS